MNFELFIREGCVSFDQALKHLFIGLSRLTFQEKTINIHSPSTESLINYHIVYLFLFNPHGAGATVRLMSIVG